MSGPVFAIRVPPRLQEVIPPTIKDVKSSDQHAKNRRRKVGMRVRMTGAGREYVWGRIGTMTSVYRLSASLESCSGVVQRLQPIRSSVSSKAQMPSCTTLN